MGAQAASRACLNPRASFRADPRNCVRLGVAATRRGGRSLLIGRHCLGARARSTACVRPSFCGLHWLTLARAKS